MGIAALLKTPGKLYDELAAFAGSKESIEQGLSSLSYANGLMTAVIVSPVMVRPSEWMDMLVPASGGLDIEDAQLAVNLTLLEYYKILESLAADECGYEPFFWQDADGRTVTSDWAQGFLDGIRLRKEDWAPLLESDDHVIEKTLYIMLQDEKVDAYLRESGIEPEKIAASLQAGIPALVKLLYETSGGDDRATASLPRVDTGTFMRAEKKTGRNDPCPCGSGKKYKKCCLN